MTSPSTAGNKNSQDPSIRVLLAEDDDDLRNGLAEYLRLRFLSVTDVATGVAVHRALRASRFDVVILDVNLPDASGFDLAREIAAQPRHDMGIVLLTARAGRQDRIRGYEEGADLYLTKPVDGDELLLAIRNLARRVASARPEEAEARMPEPPREAGTWQLDLLHQRLVSPGGATLPLTGREMMVMEQLARAQGAPIARHDLAGRLGYTERGAESRGLDAILHRLRRKAAERGLDLPLVGVHAVGIRFSAPLGAR